jgi:hypothetical protein
MSSLIHNIPMYIWSKGLAVVSVTRLHRSTSERGLPSSLSAGFRLPTIKGESQLLVSSVIRARSKV